MTEDDFKAVFIACMLTHSDFGPERIAAEADRAWRIYAESRRGPEVGVEQADRWRRANLDGLLTAVMESGHATLLRVAELVDYAPMEPRP